MVNDTNNVSKVMVMWKDKCLFLRKNDNTWELPGGHLNVGEKFKVAAIREVKEETGLKLSKLKLVIKQKDFRLYITRAKVIKVNLSDEHNDYIWINSKDIRRITLSDATKINIKTILDAIERV